MGKENKLALFSHITQIWWMWEQPKIPGFMDEQVNGEW